MSLTFDLRDFERYARKMDALANQIPFALAQALNASAEIARKEIIEKTWPEHVTVRDPRFIGNALTIQGRRATKRNLRVEIYDKNNPERASLTLHEKGGAKRPKGATLAVPSDAVKVRRSGRGVPKAMRPGALPKSGPTGAFRKGDVLYQRTGKGKTRGLKLLYVLKPSTRIEGTVPFHADFARTMRRTMPIQFRLAMRKAMATARRTK